MEETEMKVRIDDIQVRERHRKDLGDVGGLAESIKAVGLLHPIVLGPDRTLIAGQRRLEAVRLLGWAEVPVRVVTGLDDAAVALRAERDENSCRLAFNPVEAVKLGRKLEEFERAAARERQAQAGPSNGPGVKSNGLGKLPEAAKGETRDRVGDAVGMSGRSYEKAKAVVEAAEREPAKYGHLVERMQRTGKVDGPYRELRQQSEPAGQKPRRQSKNFKVMLDKVTEAVKTHGEKLPAALLAVRGEEGRGYASKLAELATTLDRWAKEMSPPAPPAKA
jgi:ParB family chromosome partitioning protein